MKKAFLGLCLLTALFACNSNETKVKSANTDSSNRNTTAVDLPFKPSYSSNWSNEVSDADLKMVLTTYKDWADNNMAALGQVMADTVELDMASGGHSKKTKAELMKMWSTYRDSLSSVQIKMDTWNKMYSTDKKESYIVVWYDETDTYKSGKVDSASFHDINQIKNGKIVWYSQYKRPKK